ncbi:MAG: hypothetical protein KGO02_11350 [Alphaproteobacteria bacterium]|nr:hypothetical protein [Alphaproteobacteria bacterium]
MSDLSAFERAPVAGKRPAIMRAQSQVVVDHLEDLIALSDGLRNASMYMAAARRLSGQGVPVSSLGTDVIEKAMEELNLVRSVFMRICESLMPDEIS